MKKVLCLLLVIVLALGLFAGCGPKDKVDPNAKEIAFVTDIGTIDDKSFNEGTYAGVESWAKKNNKTYAHYEPKTQDKTDLIDAMEQAITNGAKVVVTAGFVFPEALTDVAKAHPEVNFILCDAGVEPILPNIATFQYLAEYAGYMAGYAVVKEGMKNLAFIGGMNFPTVYGAGQGFAKGADDAAKELNIKIDLAYGYTMNFADTAENKAMMAAVIAKGAEVILSFGGGNTFSAFSAASEATPKRWVITPDTDGTSLSDRALTSVMKELAKSVEVALDDIYNNDFKKYGGKNSIVGVDDGMVGLPFANSKFTKFTKADYDALVKSLAGKSVIVDEKAEKDLVGVLKLTNTTVRYL